MSKRIIEPPLLGIAALYFIFFTLLLWPVTDFLSTVLPLQMGRVEWRYASLGIMAVYVTTPIMGVGLAMVLAFFLRHRFVLQFLSYLCLVGAVLLMLAIVVLGLATAHYRGIVSPEGMPSMQIGGLIAGLKHLSAFIAVSLLGLGGLQASRRISEEPRRKDAGDPAPWVRAHSESPGGTAT